MRGIEDHEKPVKHSERLNQEEDSTYRSLVGSSVCVVSARWPRACFTGDAIRQTLPNK